MQSNNSCEDRGRYNHKLQAGHAPTHLHVHDHGSSGRLQWVFAITAVYLVAEAVGGWLTGSLALLADAGHMAADAFAIGLALLAARIGSRPPTRAKTYGYFRLETIAAFINAIALIAISASIFHEAVERIFAPHEVAGGGMIVIAAGGLVVNLVSLWILHGQHNHDLNSHGAWLHMIGDLLGSVGALIAGVAVSMSGRSEIDALVSIVIGAIVFFSSWGLVRRASHILLEGAPAHLNVETVARSILSIDGARRLHDLHIWTIASGRDALTCHIVHDASVQPNDLLARLRDHITREFGIDHITLQMEDEFVPGQALFRCRSGSECFSLSL